MSAAAHHVSEGGFVLVTSGLGVAFGTVMSTRTVSPTILASSVARIIAVATSSASAIGVGVRVVAIATASCRAIAHHLLHHLLHLSHECQVI